MIHSNHAQSVLLTPNVLHAVVRRLSLDTARSLLFPATVVINCRRSLCDPFACPCPSNLMMIAHQTPLRHMSLPACCLFPGRWETLGLSLPTGGLLWTKASAMAWNGLLVLVEIRLPEADTRRWFSTLPPVCLLRGILMQWPFLRPPLPCTARFCSLTSKGRHDRRKSGTCVYI